MKILFASFAFFLFLTACTASKWASPNDSHVAGISAKYPGASVEQLKQGRKVFVDNCDSCHLLDKLRNKDEAALGRIVPVMVEKVNKKKGDGTIGKEDQEALLRYLVAVNTAN